MLVHDISPEYCRDHRGPILKIFPVAALIWIKGAEPIGQKTAVWPDAVERAAKRV
jgi:hypothetical protein